MGQPSPCDELSTLSFYYGLIDSKKAVTLLQYERPGTFLLRTSPNSKRQGAFNISLMKNRTIEKTNIYHFTGYRGQDGRYYANSERSFATIAQLVDFYKTHDFQNNLGLTGIRLLHPFEKERREHTRLHDVDDGTYSYAGVGDRLENLLEHLKLLDDDGEEVCECGIKVADSKLPGGWTLHQTQAAPRRVFFQHESNLTQWTPPQGVFVGLPEHQRLYILSRLAVDN